MLLEEVCSCTEVLQMCRVFSKAKDTISLACRKREPLNQKGKKSALKGEQVPLRTCLAFHGDKLHAPMVCMHLPVSCFSLVRWRAGMLKDKRVQSFVKISSLGDIHCDASASSKGCKNSSGLKEK